MARAVDRYVYVSSIAAYRDFPYTPGIDESWPVRTPADPTAEEITVDTLGPLKALCEEAVEEVLPGRVLTVRPGLIVGPHDPTGRFTYWPRRVAQGGEVLAPGGPDLRVQIIDVRDLAGWVLRVVESGRTGTYNATGPDYPLTMRRLLEACRAASGSDASFTWVGEEFLLRSGVTMELAPWIPGAPARRQ
jgi:2'-hydroxyisoflavone reductase